MRIVITGCTGMIGATLAKVAIDEGHEVIGIVRPGSKNMSNLPISEKLEVIECDISDYNQITKDCKCDIFYHMAWDKTFGEGRDDVRTQIDNIGYTMDAVNLAKKWGASAFVGAGSQAEYGHVEGKIDGNTKVNPTSGYGIAKYSAGKLARILCKQLGMRFCWTRILSTYGINDAGHTLIMYLINTLLKGDVPELTKCEQIWDYTFSEDAAHAFLSIGLKGVDGRTYPIGSGECRSLKEFVCDVRDAIDPDLYLEFGVKEYYPHQTMMLCADITELTADTGFKPKYSFKEGIQKTICSVRKDLEKI